MKKIYLFGVLFSMVFGSLALTACGGSDDDNNTPPPPPAGPTSIVANWEGQWAANPNEPNQLLWRYAHRIKYEIRADATFNIKACACHYSTDAADAQYDKASIPAIDPARPAGAYLVERIAYQCYGSYTLDEANKKITLTITHEGYYDESTNFFVTQSLQQALEATWSYTLSGNTLKINDGSPIQVNPHCMIAYGEMAWVQ